MRNISGAFLPLIIFLGSLSPSRPTHPFPSPACPNDSTKIIHNLDGSTEEWPASKFEKDEETQIRYALDNDETRLYIAMQIPDLAEQMKIMRMGMKLFIDLKAKKKENMGIEFPVKEEVSMGSEGTGDNNSNRSASGNTDESGRRRFDPKAMRSSMILKLIYMRPFGFVNQEETKEQGLILNGIADIAFSWDSSDVMHIEYGIQLSRIAELSSLQNKLITIGWKINGRDYSSSPVGSVGTSSSALGSRRASPGAGRSTPTRGSSDGNNQQMNFEKMMNEQAIWTKYIFFPSGAPPTPQ